MYLWKRLATPRWWIDNEQALRARAGGDVAVIERPGRERLQLEAVCRSSGQLKQFGGRVEKLPRDWLKRLVRRQKTKALKIGKRSLIIPAGTAFGTGDHATTAMSPRLLEDLTRDWKPGWSIVDLGTGSGILALAARCLGAKRAVGIDIDPMAIKTAKGNARRNKIDKVDFRLADVRRWKFPRKIDIVTANLFSELLIEVLPKLRSQWLILSGVLREQKRELVGALKRNKIDIVEVRRRGKWIAVLAKN
jgi:ribosomal protein L11 methyltransferase